MSPTPALPKISVNGEESSEYNFHTEPGRMPSRPPLSRQSTEVLTEIGHGNQTFPKTIPDRPRDQKQKIIHRSQTDAGIDELISSEPTTFERPETFSKVNTGGSVRSVRRNMERDLSQQIASKMSKMEKIGLDGSKDYISDEELCKLMSVGNVTKALGVDRELAEVVVDFALNNPKVLAITLLVHKDKDDRLTAMEEFERCQFTDACLPIKNLSSEQVCPILCPCCDMDDECSHPKGLCDHDSEADAFHCFTWTQPDFNTFFLKQWSFLVPTFLDSEFETEFGEHVILPFICDHSDDSDDNENKGGEGHFGDVRLVKILANYQNAIETDKARINVALKEMKLHSGKEYDDFVNWKRETKALKVFNGLHKHIVRGIGSFIQRKKLFVLMEWADRGDLGNVFLKIQNPHFDLTETRVAEFLEQFRGLADALRQMHDYPVSKDGDLAGLVLSKEEEVAAESPAESKLTIYEATQSSKSTTTIAGGKEDDQTSQHENGTHSLRVHLDEPEIEISITKPSRTTENWRHGDLKPNNILSFGDNSSWLGTLKLADLGRAKQHMNKTGKRIGTSEKFGTLPYDPPEVWTSLSQGRSRLVDIWAFGCVFLESIIWLLFGYEVLDTFRSRSAGIVGSLYWADDNIHIKTAKLNAVTFDWINLILREDPECKASVKGSALRDLIVLIRQKLLVIKLPADSDAYEEGCRINCNTLVKELDTIIKRGEDDPSYLFSGKSRAGVAAPPFTQVRLPQEQQKSQLLTPHARLSGANVAQNRTPAPWTARPESGAGQRYDSYIHDFDDKWEYVDDNLFAAQILDRPEIYPKHLMPNRTSRLCNSCEKINWNYDFETKCSLAELRKRAEEGGCEFCSLLLRTAGKFASRDWVEFDKVGSGLRINGSADLPVLTIRRAPEKLELANELSPHIQIGFPRIPNGGSLSHYGVLRAWLEDCDQNHATCRTSRPNSMPTRVIDVGTIESPSLHLVESSSLPETARHSFRYIALSYPWGTDPPHTHFVTDSQNVKNHRLQIPASLPKTLADAVETTRHLNVRYIWIDSLCIIQGPGGDFAEEADRMEAVFSSAYCVIAATSAHGTSSGFLERKSKRELGATNLTGEKNRAVTFQDHDANGKPTGLIFIDERFDDFEGDVLKGLLNQRGWVFQERALARRTIHFTNNQTYWECGQGIRCETLSKLKNTRVSFLGDPNFPSYGMQGSKGGIITFYEDIYEQYSRLSFSKIEDRPLAINGLEQRLKHALKEKGFSDRGYWGIFDDYWGRGLLWRRTTGPHGVEKMIRLKSGASGGDPAPSWSWEGYFGGITFMKPEPHSVEWLAKEVTLPWSQFRGAQAQMTTASYRGERILRGVARDFRIPEKNEKDEMNDDIVYDDEADRLNRGPLKVLIIGRMNVEGRSREDVRNCVLVLARKESAAENVYERIGAGSIDGSLISFDKDEECFVE